MCVNAPSIYVGVCRNLKSIVVQIGIEDYFEDPNSPEARKLFDEMVNKLQVTAPLCLTVHPHFTYIVWYTSFSTDETSSTVQTKSSYRHSLLKRRKPTETQTCLLTSQLKLNFPFLENAVHDWVCSSCVMVSCQYGHIITPAPWRMKAVLKAKGGRACYWWKLYSVLFPSKNMQPNTMWLSNKPRAPENVPRWRHLISLLFCISVFFCCCRFPLRQSWLSQLT